MSRTICLLLNSWNQELNYFKYGFKKKQVCNKYRCLNLEKDLFFCAYLLLNCYILSSAHPEIQFGIVIVSSPESKIFLPD